MIYGVLVMAASIISERTKTRVSSVLNNDIKQFGKKYLLDRNEDTCWNSEQGSPQWVIVDLGRQCYITEIRIQFQGGFVGKNCWIEGKLEGSDFRKVMQIFPEDNSSQQIFKMPEDAFPVDFVKIIFNNSTDFYGRITIYDLDIVGNPC